MVTIFGIVVPSSEANEQLTDDDLLSFMENQETALKDNSSCVGELDAYLADCNVNNCMQFWQENFNKFPKLPAASETLLHSRYISSNGEMFQCRWLYRECSAIQAD